MIIIHRAANGLVIEDKDEFEKISVYHAIEETSDEEVDEYKFTRRALYAIAEALSLSFGSKHDVKLELCFMKDGVDIEEAAYGDKIEVTKQDIIGAWDCILADPRPNIPQSVRNDFFRRLGFKDEV